MRPLLGKVRGPMSPVLRISADGQSTTLFDLSNAQEIKEASSYEVYDFAVRNDGTLLELAALTTKDHQPVVAVIQVDPEDKSISLTHLDYAFSPRQLVPLPNGMLLVSGMQSSNKTSEGHTVQTFKPIAAIFDSGGRFVRELELTDDIKMAEIDSSKTENPDITGLQAVDLSQFVVAEDGTSYLFRAGVKPKVYAISSAGQVIRSFPITTPTEDTSIPSMMYATGRLAFDFFVPISKDDPRKHLIIRVFDAQDGHVLWDYVPAKDVYGIPACYNGQGFTLLQADSDRHLALVRVSP